MSRPPEPTRRQALALGTVAGFTLLTSRSSAAEPPMASKKSAAVLLTTADLKPVHQLVKSSSTYLYSQARDRVAFSPDGKLAAVSGGHEYAGVWEVATGKQVQKFSTSTNAVAFRPTGEVVTASVGNEGVPGPFNVWTVGKEKPAELFTHRFERLALSADGSLLAGPTFWNRKPGDAETALLSTKDGKEIARAPYADTIFAVTNDHFVTGKWPKEEAKGVWTVRVWGKDGKAVAETEGAPPVASNGETLALRGTDPAEVVVWNPVAKTKVVVKHRLAQLTAVGLSADGKKLATAGPEKKPELGRYGIALALVPQTVTVWDMGTGKEVASATVGDVQFQWLAFSPDGKHLLAAGSEDLMDR